MTEHNTNRKILLKDVNWTIDKEKIELIFENKRVLGSDDFQIKTIEEIPAMPNESSVRDIIIEYEMEENVNKIIEMKIVKYKDLEFQPLRFDIGKKMDETNGELKEQDKEEKENKEQEEEEKENKEKEEEEEKAPVIFEIKDAYKYPFYLFNINSNYLNDFNHELERNNAKIKFIDDDRILIESTLKFKKDDGNDWISNLKALINTFLNDYFTQFEIKSIPFDLFLSLRDKLIDKCYKNDKISLIFSNDKSNFFLRIDGKRDLIEELRQNIEVQSMEF